MRKWLLLPAIVFILLSLCVVQQRQCAPHFGELVPQYTAMAFTGDAGKVTAAFGIAQPPPADAPPTARNFPWLPVLLGLTVVIGALVYSAKRRNKGT